MTSLAAVTTIALVVIMMLFAAIIVVKMLNGGINTRGILKTDDGAAIDPERLLMMMGTIVAAFGYFSYGLNTGARDGALPDLPEAVVTALGGSNLLYLSGKIFRTGKIVA